MKRVRRRDRRIWFLAVGVFVAVFLFSFLATKFKSLESEVEAASLANFDPGYIISDWQMGNYNSMSEAEIQAFLTSKGNCRDTRTYLTGYYPHLSYHIKDGHFVCLAEEVFGEGVSYGEGVSGGATAAHIIYRAAQDYRINPQVLIVLLEKEQGLITDSWPNDRQYRSATGYGCPDTAPCSAEYYGFKNQVRKAAAMFRTVLNGGWTNYPLGNNYVQYNPSAACGGTVVNIRSLATSALYRYTPYQPNASALAAGYGTGDGCGAYGNRNFYLYFEDWFGGITRTQSDIELEIEKMGLVSKVGKSISAQHGGLKDGASYQLFENAVVYKHPTLGTNAVMTGAVRDLYRSYGLENGALGYPISEERSGLKDGASYQLFENAVVYKHPTLGTHAVMTGDVRDLHRNNKLENGLLGYPISEENNGYQEFENGFVVSEKKIFKKSILDEYKYTNDLYGEALSDTICGLRNSGCYQIFTNGIVYLSDNGVFIVENGNILSQFRTQGRENGIGYPTSYMSAGKQSFENGEIEE